MNIKSGKTSFILILLLLMGLSGCEEKKHDGVISRGETFVVSTDSITIEGIVFKPPFTDIVQQFERSTVNSITTDSFPRFKSSSPVIDALYDIGVKELLQIQVADSVAERLGVSSTGEDIINWMTLSLIDRKASMNALKMKGKKIGGSDPSVFRSHLSWITAAWENYCLDGSNDWLNEIYSVSKEIMDRERAIGYDRRINLMKGGMELLDTRERLNIYPVWAGARDVYCTMSLMNNLFYINGLNLMSLMSERLNRKEIGEEKFTIDDMMHRVNRSFWTPENNNYCDYLYAEPYYIQSPYTDNAASSLAVIFKVATPDMANLILSKTPITEKGLSAIFPNRPIKGMTYKVCDYPMVNALWGVAASVSGNEEELALAMGSIACGGTDCSAVASNGAAMVMLALRGVAGIRVNSDSLVFEPTVPEFFNDRITLENFKYRNSTLNIEIYGSGTNVESFTFDGEKRKSCSITSEMAEGTHQVVIRMAKHDNKRYLKNGNETRKELLTAPASPELSWLNSLTGQFVGTQSSDNYIVYANGIIDMEGSGKDVNLSNIENFSEFCIVPVANDGLKGFSAQPHYVYPRGSVMTLQAEDFYEPGTNLIKDKILSSRLVENGSGKNRTLKFKVTLNREEDVFLDVCYSNGNGKQYADSAVVLRDVVVNGKEMGVFFLAGRGDGWWLSTGMSNMIGCTLKEGENIIEIRTNRKYHTNKRLLIDYLRIIKAKTFADKERNEKNRNT